MTVHAAKGLEFQSVFVVGLEHGLFPHERLNLWGSQGLTSWDKDEEEERRLFYVAVTRAKQSLTLSYAATRSVFGTRKINIPSEFIGDIPAEFMRLTTSEKPIYI